MSGSSNAKSKEKVAPIEITPRNIVIGSLSNIVSPKNIITPSQSPTSNPKPSDPTPSTHKL